MENTIIEKGEDGFDRIIRMSTAFDKRNPDPNKDYGITAMNMWFILRGEKGATQFMVGTPMYLPEISDELWFKGGKINYLKGDGWDIGYHAKNAQYEGQEPMDCGLLDEGKCYYDGSSLQASEFYPTFVSEGPDAVWAMLRKRYQEIFEDES